MTTISRETARAIAIAATGLNQRRSQPASKTDVLATLRQLGIIQIDTINVVARAPYFVLWSRLGEYDPAWFDQIQYPDGLMFEYWAHAASFLPIELWPLLRPKMVAHRTEAWSRESQWITENQAVLDHVESEIRARGPLRSADFQDENHDGGGWWNWKPAKTALDVLWSMGRLMVQRREKFQRVYELTERVLPDWDDSQMPAPEEASEHLTLLGLRGLALGTAPQVADYFRQKTPIVRDRLSRWSKNGAVIPVRVEGWDEPAYLHPEYAHWLSDGPPPSTHTTILTPFDNLVWDRARNVALWDFEYRIECYTPAPKRRYGYFSLPILRHDMLIGRLDAKAERKNGVFRVFSIHLEPQVQPHDELVADVAQALKDCAAWHRTPEVVIERSDPPALKELLHHAVA